MSENNRLENKVDKIIDDTTEIKITLAKQHIVLVEHESRSTKLENIVLPIHKKFMMLEGALKFIGIISVILGIIEAIRMMIGK